MGTGYSRNDTSNNIADGNVIDAADLDGEFDAIESAFSGTVGHSHDGSTGEGPQIDTVGIADGAVTPAKIDSASTFSATGFTATNAVTADTVSEYTTNTGVTVDGVLLKDSQVTTDQINENTAAAGVTVNSDLKIGDDDKAFFGADSDLQIYHDSQQPRNLIISQNNTPIQLGTGGLISIVSSQSSLLLNGADATLTGNDSISLSSTAITTATGTSGVTLDNNGTTRLATTSTGIDVTGAITTDGLTTSADINFGDDDKAIFGAGSDLEIYHFSTSSPNGNAIKSKNSTNLNLVTDEGRYVVIASQEFFTPGYIQSASFNIGGSVRLFHDNVVKFETTSTGIDVTGVITTDGLTTSADINFGDNDKAAFGTDSDLQIYHDGTDNYISSVVTQGTDVAGSNLTISAGQGFGDADGGELIFKVYYTSPYTGTGTTPGTELTALTFTQGADAIFGGDVNVKNNNHIDVWENDYNVNGAHTLITPTHINFATKGGVVSTSKVFDGQTFSYTSYIFGPDTYFELDVSNCDVRFFNSDNNKKLEWQGDTEQLEFADSVKATYGADADLEIYHDGNHNYVKSTYPDAVDRTGSDLILTAGAGTGTGLGGSIYFKTSTTSAFATSGNTPGSESNAMKIDQNGDTTFYNAVVLNSLYPSLSLMAGTSSIAYITMGDTADSDIGKIEYNNADDSMAFTVNASERMVIDSLGNVGIGAATPGASLDIHRSNAVTLRLHHDYNSSIQISGYYNNSTIRDTDKTGDPGINFADNAVLPAGGNSGTSTPGDNTLDFGSSSYRWQDIYATNGTIQTSDEREKQDIAELSDAERNVAVAAKGLLRKFRWKDSVAEKGDDARIHFGIIAQDLQAAFEAEGLDAGDYAMFIHTTWTDEETGEEESRMGVRYSELLSFIIAAI
jgi:hypothetical protein